MSARFTAAGNCLICNDRYIGYKVGTFLIKCLIEWKKQGITILRSRNDKIDGEQGMFKNNRWCCGTYSFYFSYRQTKAIQHRYILLIYDSHATTLFIQFLCQTITKLFAIKVKSPVCVVATDIDFVSLRYC